MYVYDWYVRSFVIKDQDITLLVYIFAVQINFTRGTERNHFITESTLFVLFLSLSDIIFHDCKLNIRTCTKSEVIWHFNRKSMSDGNHASVRKMFKKFILVPFSGIPTLEMPTRIFFPAHFSSLFIQLERLAHKNGTHNLSVHNLRIMLYYYLRVGVTCDFTISAFFSRSTLFTIFDWTSFKGEPQWYIYIYIYRVVHWHLATSHFCTLRRYANHDELFLINTRLSYLREIRALSA